MKAQLLILALVAGFAASTPAMVKANGLELTSQRSCGCGCNNNCNSCGCNNNCNSCGCQSCGCC